MKKHYFGVFTKTKEAVEVTIPDIKGCHTFGKDIDEAYEMAIDALAAVLANADPKFIKEKPSTFEEISSQYNGDNQTVFPVPVDDTIIESYAPKRRVNVVFPVEVLKQIDETRGKLGERDRSKFITDGMKEYTQKFA
ncbi:type II toxin-antitoxin system HicB family antitoxin [bacterium]|nr:type II toxin-antitoxin system HicB family antitoxin [bacterium]